LNSPLELTVQEYCAEDSSYTVQGKLPAPPDLKELAERARSVYGRTMLMEKLAVLVALAGTSTIHVHGNGDLVVTGVENVERARELLEPLLGASSGRKPRKKA